MAVTDSMEKAIDYPDNVLCVHDEGAPTYSIPKLKRLSKELGRSAETFTEEELKLCLA